MQAIISAECLGCRPSFRVPGRSRYLFRFRVGGVYRQHVACSSPRLRCFACTPTSASHPSTERARDACCPIATLAMIHSYCCHSLGHRRPHKRNDPTVHNDFQTPSYWTQNLKRRIPVFMRSFWTLEPRFHVIHSHVSGQRRLPHKRFQWLPRSASFWPHGAQLCDHFFLCQGSVRSLWCTPGQQGPLFKRSGFLS